jgi:hypothetical protein
MATKLTATSNVAVKKILRKKKQLSSSTAACIIILVASCATRTSRRWHTCSRPTPSRVRYGTRPWLGCGFPASLPTVQPRCWNGPRQPSSPPPNPCAKVSPPRHSWSLGCSGNRGTPRSALNLLARIKEEAVLWARAGASGLRVVLPSIWDVHWCIC